MRLNVLFIILLITVLGCKKEVVDIPTLSTNTVSEITTNSAKSGGTIISTGGGSILSRGVCWSIQPNPSISNSHTSDGDGTGSFASIISDLTSNTLFYVRAYAENEAGIAYGEQIAFETLPTVLDLISAGYTVEELLNQGIAVIDLVTAGISAKDLLSEGVTPSELFNAGVTVSELFNERIGVGELEDLGATEQSLTDAGLIGALADIDGNSYKWVKVGDQIWMAENLRTITYNDSSPIHNLTSEYDGETYIDGAFRWYDDDSLSYHMEYGVLYNHYAVIDSKDVCPTGWHVPTINEYTVLMNYRIGQIHGGGHLKEKGLEHWESPNEGATNSTGFLALPAGTSSSKDYAQLGKVTMFASSETYSDNPAQFQGIYLKYDSDFLYFTEHWKTSFVSLRCIKD